MVTFFSIAHHCVFSLSFPLSVTSYHKKNIVVKTSMKILRYALMALNRTEIFKVAALDSRPNICYTYA
jgi:hypothetical protein